MLNIDNLAKWVSMAILMLLGNTMQMTYSIFLCNFQYNSCCPFIISDSTDKQKDNNISKTSMKSVNFQFFLGQHLTNPHESLISGFHGNHCLKTAYLVKWKFFNTSD